MGQVHDDLLTACLRPDRLADAAAEVTPTSRTLNREIKAMAGVTPSELRAFVQHTDDLLH